MAFQSRDHLELTLIGEVDVTEAPALAPRENPCRRRLPGRSPHQPPHVVRTTHQVGSYVRTVQYEIRVLGHLGTRWTAWFDGLSITTEDDGTTVLRGFVVDQAALHGLLHKLRDVGIPLISLTPVEAPTAERLAPDPEGNQP
jgi:hypothetical protein